MLAVGLELSVAFPLVVAIGVVTGIFMLGLYDTKAGISGTGPVGRWADKLAFLPEDLGGFSYGRLALVSMLGLFFELLLIRWISSEIRVFAYFKNFVLIACFLGFGLGCYLCRRKINLLPLIVPAVLLALLVKLPWTALRQLVRDLPFYLGAGSEVSVWGMPSVPSSWPTLLYLAVAVGFTLALFALVMLVFIPIGQMVGWYLENAQRGILGYSINVLASVVGIVLYTLLCFLHQPPAAWFLLGAVMLVLTLGKLPRMRWVSAAAFAVCIALLMLKPGKGSTVYWSPYQKLTLTPIRDGNRELIAYQLSSNDSWYQEIINLSPEFVSSHPELFEKLPLEWNAYNIPYKFCPNPSSVLVLGSGTGNDVAAALRNGVTRVVAVEIDPLIRELGRRLHFEKPYNSPRVSPILDDARSYVENSQDRFDMIVFSLLDSHTTTSYFTNIRIDNYVYTVQALEAARRLLKPDGVFIVKFWVDAPWIAGRLQGLLESVFGYPPVQMQAEEGYTTPGRFFIAGERQRIMRALSDRKLADYVEKHRDFEMAKATLTTDDWPYFYQREPGLPASVLLISAVLLVLCWLLLRRTGVSGLQVRWHFFFLGAGFLLLEAQIVSKMALLFGTTWVVNSIVISGLLLLIVASNILVELRPRIPLTLGYAGILVTLALAYSIPLEKLFFASVWLKGLVATAVLCAPVFFAGIVFIRSFASAGFRGEALGSNLLGALAGGLLESLSLWTGLKSLLIIAALLYLASYFALHQKQAVRGGQLETIPTGHAS